ncbi:hypothetical protein [Methanosphaera sp. BMS]|uniref:hypothetical protein n=1 Tax=Methanosphaera sp. BMS TaxID=1789762 RepID=UPI000DC1ED89|nr:hypothetical protein [Methanosphaera sp. BMS]AWX32135.1 hypothetical protein AW729_03045 [Methanosphaera sp. BMS]
MLKRYFRIEKQYNNRVIEGDIITYKNMKVSEILADEEYPHQKSLQNLLKRIRSLNQYIVEEVTDDKILFKTRDMVFIYVEPLDDCVKVSTDFYADRIIDLANKYEVIPKTTMDGTDTISYSIKNPMFVQYGVSLAQQAFTRFKRLKI